jgi:hypothetical protein
MKLNPNYAVSAETRNATRSERIELKVSRGAVSEEVILKGVENRSALQLRETKNVLYTIQVLPRLDGGGSYSCERIKHNPPTLDIQP